MSNAASEARRLMDEMCAVEHRYGEFNEAAELGRIATISALLAIEERLGELVEQQRLNNALAAAPPFVSVFRGSAEFDQVAATARRLLGLDADPEGGVGRE